ncbi:MAG: hypothetical protein N2508_06185 [Anaerolineae bacterium]|nr:hypothetical protein [Anaerolineae bacterium]
MTENEREPISLDEQYLTAIQALKSELRDLLGPEEGKRLNRRLGQYLRWARSPQHREVSLTRALKAIGEHPPARQRIAEMLYREGVKDVQIVYRPLPGEPEPVPAGTVMVCPVDPNHYRRRLQFTGQRLYCPEHNVDLVPEEDARG